MKGGEEDERKDKKKEKTHVSSSKALFRFSSSIPLRADHNSEAIEVTVYI